MQTVRALEAEWRRVLWRSVGTGTKEDESSVGHVCAAGLHQVMARSHLAHFETYEPFISLILKFFQATVNCG
jgi:hypothetical protein